MKNVRTALGPKMYTGLPALGLKMYQGQPALGLKLYQGQPALNYHLVTCCTQGCQPLVKKYTEGWQP